MTKTAEREGRLSTELELLCAGAPSPCSLSLGNDLKVILTGLAALCLAVLFSQRLILTSLQWWYLILFCLATGIPALILRWLAGRRRLDWRKQESLAALIAGLALLSSCVNLYQLGGFSDTANLLLLAVGMGTFFLPMHRLVLVLTTTLAVWVAIVWLASPTVSWLYFAFGLFAATGLRVHTDTSRAELAVALESARREISRRQQMESALRESEERYALAARGSRDGLWDWDLRSNQVYFATRWKEMLGFGEEEVGSQPSEWLDRVHPQDRPALESALQKHLKGETPFLSEEYRLQKKDGSYMWVLTRGLAVRSEDGTPYRLAGSQTDITRQKEAEQWLLYAAYHDPLTGLANRALFLDHLTKALERFRRYPSQTFAVLFLDLDRFKLVNDSLGHVAGDTLLRAVAARLRSCLRSADSVARFGGDEFAILLEAIEDSTDAVRVAQRIQQHLQTPFQMENREVFTSASIGIVVATPNYRQAEEMLRDADTAMYRAKGKGKARIEVFDHEMYHRAMAALDLENDLRRALNKHEFRLHYQPVVSLKTGTTAWVEALLRWQRPGHGLVSPYEFLGVAEETDLILPIGAWVIREACRQIRIWRQVGLNLGVSVNLSAKQLTQADFLKEVQSCLAENGLGPESLRFEVTEAIMSQTEQATAETLQELRQAGFQILLDDFGTGYSSFSSLHKLPVDACKIDRSFVIHLGRDQHSRDVLETMADLIRRLGMEIVVEGVETPQQLHIVRKLRCDYLQGYYFCRPQAPKALQTFLSGARRALPAGDSLPA